MESRMDRMEKLMINLIEKIDQSKGKAENVWFSNPDGLIIQNGSSKIILRAGYNDVQWCNRYTATRRPNTKVWLADKSDGSKKTQLRCWLWNNKDYFTAASHFSGNGSVIPSIFGFLISREPLPVYFQFSFGKTSHKWTQLLKITCQLANKFI